MPTFVKYLQTAAIPTVVTTGDALTNDPHIQSALFKCKVPGRTCQPALNQGLHFAITALWGVYAVKRGFFD